MKPQRGVVLLCAAASAVAVSACGSSSKSSSSKPTSSTPASTGASSERAQAKTALARWIRDDTVLNRAIDKWNRTEARHAQMHDVFAVRRDAYDYRNGIYNFDIAIRKISFPPSIQPDVNKLLDATRTKIAALDGMSQSSKPAVIDRYHLKMNAVDVTGAANRVFADLKRVARG